MEDKVHSKKDMGDFLLDLPSLPKSKQVHHHFPLYQIMGLYPSPCQILCPGSDLSNPGSIPESIPDRVPNSISIMGLYPGLCQILCPRSDLFCLLDLIVCSVLT